jgi:hypothetical protein
MITVENNLNQIAYSIQVGFLNFITWPNKLDSGI